MNKLISQCENQTKVSSVIDCTWYMGNHKALGLDPSLRLSLRCEIVGGAPEEQEHILACYIIHHLSVTRLAETLAAASSKQTK